MENNKFNAQILKNWKIYCKFSDNEIQRKNNSLFIINHFFFNPIKPTYSILRILDKVRCLSFKKKITLKFKFYSNLLRYIIKRISIAFIFNSFLKKTDLNLNQKYDYIIVSHLNNEDRFKNSIDPYFGNLLNFLKGNNKKILLVLIPHFHIGTFKKNRISDKIMQYNYHILSENYTDQIELFKDIKIISGERRRLLKKSTRCIGLKKNLYIYAAETIIAKHNQRNHNYGREIKHIIKKTSAKNLITTFEGHSWEKIFFYYARQANKNIKCLGYQHSLIFKYSHSILRKIDYPYTPNYVLASGKSTANIIEKKLQSKTNVKIFGNHKHKKINFKTSYNQSNIILFLPSGEIEEANYMTNFAIKFARLHPELEIVIRYHPIVKDKFYKIKNFKNFTNSSSEIIKDCKNSRWAIYSSSTAIFEAIQYGCIPINFIGKKLICINDPLWQINRKLIYKVETENDLLSIIRKTTAGKLEKKMAQEYKSLLYKLNNLICKNNKKILLKI